jgi:DNA-binding transcriptional LysR family regulator
MLTRVHEVDIKLLRVFVAIVEAGSFSVAAARLNIAESTISQYMSDLEARLGMTLCSRGRAGFSLTKDGEAVHGHTVEFLLQTEAFRERLASIRSDRGGVIRIGLTDGIVTDTTYDFSAAIGRVLSNLPDFTFELVSDTPRMLEQAVHKGELLLAIGAEHRRVAGLRFRPFLAERNMLYCGERSPLFAMPEKSIPRDLVEQQPRIARGYLDGFDAQFFPVGNYRATVHNIETATLLILGSDLLGFLPEHYATQFVTGGRLRAVRRDIYSFASQIGAIYRGDAAANQEVVMLLRGLAEDRQQKAPRGSL